MEYVLTKWNVEYNQDHGFVALGKTWYDIIHATSVDGLVWTLEKGVSTNNNYWTQIATLNGYACVYQGGKLKGSDSFDTWKAVASQPSAGDVNSIKIINDTFVCLTNAGQVGFSANGRDWDFHTVQQGAWLRDIEFLNGKYVIVAAGGMWRPVDRVYISSDKETWTMVSIPREYKRITTDGDKFILYDGGLRFASSSDGEVWIETELSSTDVGLFSIKTLTYGAGGYFCTHGSKGAFTQDFIKLGDRL